MRLSGALSVPYGHISRFLRTGGHKYDKTFGVDDFNQRLARESLIWEPLLMSPHRQDRSDCRGFRVSHKHRQSHKREILHVT
jgi:hypothetical protein